MLTASGIFYDANLPDIWIFGFISAFRFRCEYGFVYWRRWTQRILSGIESITHVLCELMFYFRRDAVALGSDVEEILYTFYCDGWS